MIYDHFSKAVNGIFPSLCALLKATVALSRSQPFSVKHLKKVQSLIQYRFEM